jgi:hypothetical protein
MKRVLSLIILATSVLIAQPQSDVPSNMSFQGLLTDTEGIAYDDGEYQLTFRLIRVMNNGTEQTVWEESHLTNVSNGVFSVVLGSENPLPLNIPPNVLLETQVGDEILSPRQPLTSVPFALKSSRSQQAFQSVLSDTANFAHNALHATHADTANFVMNLPMVDSVQFSFNAYHSQLSDTAMVSLNAPMADTANFAHNSQHSTHADTAQYVFQAQSAVTAGFVETEVYSGTIVGTDSHSSWENLDFSTVIGTKSSLVIIRVDNTGDSPLGINFRTEGSNSNISTDINLNRLDGGISQYYTAITNSSGVVEWRNYMYAGMSTTISISVVYYLNQ